MRESLFSDEPWIEPDVIWIGGSPCSGKTTVAKRLTDRYSLVPYSCDDAFHEHKKRITPAEHPLFHRLANATCDELWMRPVPRQIDEELAFYREEFPLILDDLKNTFPQGGPIVAEGAALLPELLGRLGVEPEMAIWLVPTEKFQRREYAKRDWRHHILTDCTDPDTAWENWMARDAGFARAVIEQANAFGYRVIHIDGQRTLNGIYYEVRRHIGF